jgi:hypothetical protein
LDPDEKLCDLAIGEWGTAADKKKDGTEPKILFKKKIFLRDDDREMKDTVAKHYIYIQALYSVIESEYPCVKFISCHQFLSHFLNSNSLFSAVCHSLISAIPYA